jgi:predicted transcriptional regulator
MSSLSNEANIISAIQAIKNNPQLSVQRVAADYNVPRSTLQTRLNGVPFRRDTIANSRTIAELKKQTIIEYVLDLDSQGFSPAIADIENSK